MCKGRSRTVNKRGVKPRIGHRPRLVRGGEAREKLLKWLLQVQAYRF